MCKIKRRKEHVQNYTILVIIAYDKATLNKSNILCDQRLGGSRKEKKICKIIQERDSQSHNELYANIYLEFVRGLREYALGKINLF